MRRARSGSITSDGLYTAPQTTGTFHIIATDRSDAGNLLTATIDVVSHGFVPTGYMLVPRSRHTATRLQDGRVLIAGGDYFDVTAEIFDPGTGLFTPTGRSIVGLGMTGTLLQSGEVLLASDGAAQVYDPVVGTFTAVGSMTQRRAFHSAALLLDGRVFLVGGSDGTNRALATAELYDPARRTFTPTGSLPTGEIGLTATGLPGSGKVLVVGASGAHLFDPAPGSFASVGPMATPRREHSATLLGDGRVLVTGGMAVEGQVLDSSEIFDPATGTFAPAGHMLSARMDQTATLLPDGTVLIAGGASAPCDIDGLCYPLESAELFDPAAGTFTATGSLPFPGAASSTLLLDGTVLVTSSSGDGSAAIYR